MTWESSVPSWPACVMTAVTAVISLTLFRRWRACRISKVGGSEFLETVLLRWDPKNIFRVRDLLNGGLAILGRVGSGKTSSSGAFLARAIAAFRRSGGCILAAKPEDVDYWKKIFTKAGRSEDLKIFGPMESLRFNFLDYQLKQGAQARDIVRFLRIIGESISLAGNSGGREGDQFFQDQEDLLLFNAVEIVRLATGRVTAPDLQQFVMTAAQHPDQLSNPNWRTSFHSQCLESAHNRPKTPIESHDCDLATDFWLGQFPSMAEKTRSCILAGVYSILHVFNTGVVRELVSGDTNISPDDMSAGRWILINLPPSEWGTAGTLVSVGWKYLTQRMVLRRAATSDDFINVIWADEAQQFVTSFDAHYVAQCRSHLGCMVLISQSLPGYFAAMKGGDAEHKTHALLANFTHTIVHAVDPITAEWAAKKLGRQREGFFGGSIAPPGDVFDDLFGQTTVTGNFSEHYENVLQEKLFINGLRTGGPANGFVCDAIVIRSGEPFSSGENYLRTTFIQE